MALLAALGGISLDDCLKVLHDYPILFVGVHCPIEELERRERNRGDRIIGQARKQLSYVHRNEVYDIEVNTLLEGVGRCSERIVKALRDGRQPGGWLRTFERMQST